MKKPENAYSKASPGSGLFSNHPGNTKEQEGELFLLVQMVLLGTHRCQLPVQLPSFAAVLECYGRCQQKPLFCIAIILDVHRISTVYTD